MYSVLELCAGAGGQAIGLESAGFQHAAAVEIDSTACSTLRQNRPDWNVIESDIAMINGREFKGIDLLAGGLPCPPFSIAGKQLGSSDERDLFPQALRIVREAEPAAVMIENVPGFASNKFKSYRQSIMGQFARLGYDVRWLILHAEHYGVPQLRPRFVLVALRPLLADHFRWPLRHLTSRTVSESIHDLMGANQWGGLERWVERANRVAPTLVGGSKKHGGPDLGPTRAKEQWRQLGVDGHGIADSAPDRDFPEDGLPRLTVRMAARLQAFPDTWTFAGKKTASYRQIGNAFPPLVAHAVGESIFRVLAGHKTEEQSVPVFAKPDTLL